MKAKLAAAVAIVFESHHQSRVSAHLVNCLMPRDQDIQVVAQNRNADQSSYVLQFLK
jgi:hypothetical protein